MPKQVAFLRAINVSGKNSLKMEDLRSVFAELGCSSCTTYLQSGNVVFASPRTITPPMVDKIIADKFDVDCKVIILQASEIIAIVNNNPFIKKGFDATFCHVTMLDMPFKQSLVAKAEEVRTSGEAYLIAGKTIYLYCPNGYGKTKLSNAQWEKWCNATATTRNWKTIGAVHELVIH